MRDFDEKLNSLLSNPEAMGQIMQLAQSLGGSQESAPPPHPPSPSDAQDPFASIDPGTLMRLLPLLKDLDGRNSNAGGLLRALRPYLRPERQEKVEQALQLAHLIYVGKRYLADREGQ